MPLKNFAALAAAGAAAFVIMAPTVLARAPARDLRIADFFIGDMTARGVFRSRIAGVERHFDVDANGTIQDGVITLVERFTFEDGEKDVKTWVFTPSGPSRYTGTREDVVGAADVVEQGGRVFMSYTIDLPGKDGSTTRVNFRDVLYYDEGGRVINTARITKFGIPVARAEVIFEK